jgi:predicted transcriptional regulator of viral defense system
MHSYEVLNKIKMPEFDYNILISTLGEYNFPRNKIRTMIKNGDILRVKKGFYVKSAADYHHFVVANMIYGPSYVSEDSALAYYGLIPEHVAATTSVSLKRFKEFRTPIGDFIYTPASRTCYSFGIRRVELDAYRSFLIASPEKALFDRLLNVDGVDRPEYLEEYLFKNMRLAEDASFDEREFKKLAKLSQKILCLSLIEVLRRVNK